MKQLLASLSLLALATIAASAAIDLGTQAGNTPYDAYMRPVKSVLSNMDGGNISMERVRALMRQGRAFRYTYTDPYTAAHPSVTASVRAGDCKAKSLWLCDQIGDNTVRFVVGKSRRDSRMAHAWVMWKTEGRWWILDCTNNSRPIPADRVSRNEYIPLYSWAKNGAYRHAATLFADTAARDTTSPVADRVALR